ncbi:hypothetical protein [Novilysobacter spongiicola]|uniref:1,4-alpha-glucan branching enzyme n=1 Tax=Lysobacter spongiicola DSM 21749 TaxID=1122188 RepID=A0A1T4P1E5_9GAMM|nr:hypothetical protein [Lysobacter spongiicola]SJZ85303.1 hypothetical protein SAMN02745674_01032 [Lysobacter spongiicola DSM 21749]
MTAKHEAKTTINHEEIRRWAEARDGVPVSAKGVDEDGDEIALLRISFRDDPALKRISWDEFFERFEDDDLAFLYQEQTADGKRSRFFKMVERD